MTPDEWRFARTRSAAPRPNPNTVARVRAALSDAAFAGFVTRLAAAGYDVTEIHGTAPVDDARARQRAELARRMGVDSGTLRPVVKRSARALVFTYATDGESLSEVDRRMLGAPTLGGGVARDRAGRLVISNLQGVRS